MKKIKYSILVILAVILITVSNMLGLSGDELLEILKQFEKDALLFTDTNPTLAILIYIFTFALSIVLFMPFGVPFLLIGGALFGAELGAFWSSVANLMGATFAFLVVRYFFYDDVQKIIPKKFLRIRDAVEEDGAFYMFVLRIAPILPSEMINLILALAPVRLVSYMVVTFIARYPINYIYCTLGEDLSEIDSWNDLFSWTVFFCLMAIIAVMLIGKFLFARYTHPKYKKGAS